MDPIHYEDNQWQPLQGTDLQGFLRIVSRIDPEFSLEAVAIEWRSLPFYEDIFLVRMTDRRAEHGAQRMWYLGRDRRWRPLEGDSKPIHVTNTIAPIRLNR